MANKSADKPKTIDPVDQKRQIPAKAWIRGDAKPNKTGEIPKIDPETTRSATA